MNQARKLVILALAATAAPGALAQVPDILAAFDAGGRAMGTGGGGYQTGADTMSGYYNPAGLAYVDQAQIGLAVRNLPESETAVAGPENNLRLDSKGKRGDNGLTHAGYAFPWHGGTAAVTWTVGGFIKDTQAGTNLDNGIATYFNDIKAKTDFVNLSYGKTMRDQSASWGVSLIYAQQGIVNTVRKTFTDNQIPAQTSFVDETGNGFGAQIGFMFTPRDRSNMSLGFSYRTEINLSNNEETASLYDKIPARLAAGASVRQDGLRSGKDFAVYSLDVQHFFAAGNSSRLDRNDQTVVGFGLEYNYQWGPGRIPIRFGYSYSPKGGDGFGSRNSFTYGIGYRHGTGDWGIDFNLGRVNRGGIDQGLSLVYKLRK